jgi:hypothetical protein
VWYVACKLQYANNFWTLDCVLQQTILSCSLASTFIGLSSTCLQVFRFVPMVWWRTFNYSFRHRSCVYSSIFAIQYRCSTKSESILLAARAEYAGHSSRLLCRGDEGKRVHPAKYARPSTACRELSISTF